MVSEKKIFFKFKLNDPQGMANLDFRDMIGRIYVGDH